MKTFLKKTTALLCLCMLMPLTLLAQEMLKVQGTVTDASGEPLGFESLTEAVKGRKKINVIMKEDANINI